MTDNDLITQFCKAFNIPLETPEPHLWNLGQYALYSPKHEDLLGSGHPEAWDICSIKVIPGHRTLNDPGDPDDYELILVDSQLSLLSALEKVGQLMLRDWVDIEQQAAEQAAEDASMLMHARLHDEHPDEYEP